jgi:subtilisin family serine protease
MNTPVNIASHTASHTILRYMLVLVVALCAMVAFRPAFAAPNLEAVTEQTLTEQTLLVHFDEGTTTEMRDAAIAEMGGVLVTWMHQIHVAEIRVQGQEGLSAALAATSATSASTSLASQIVTFAESDLVVEAATVYSDPDLTNDEMSYGLTQIKATDAWSMVTGSEEIIIAVIDTGIKLDHPEFAGRLVAGYDYVNDDNQADDDMGHGTHVAGIIAAELDNGQGVAGVCPNCRLMPVKVLNENNIGSWSHVAQGILFAVDNGAQVLNLSLGAAVPSETMASAIHYAVAHDVVVVAAAGNNGSNDPYYPASLDGVIAVGGTTNTGERWSKSNFGAYIDLVAPGMLIYSTYFDLNNLYHGYTYMSGTSMAAPFVSGVAGLLLSAKPSMSADEVGAAMVASATDYGATGWDVEFGNGQVDALNALMTPTVGLVEQLDSVDTPELVQVTMFLPILSNR